IRFNTTYQEPLCVPARACLEGQFQRARAEMKGDRTMNLVGKFRSNYFAVKDRPAFEAWCQHNGLQLIVADAHADLVGFLNRSNEAGILTTVLEECDGEEEEIEIDFIEELA